MPRSSKCFSLQVSRLEVRTHISPAHVCYTSSHLITVIIYLAEGIAIEPLSFLMLTSRVSLSKHIVTCMAGYTSLINYGIGRMIGFITS
jgi:hypothetical protein